MSGVKDTPTSPWRTAVLAGMASYLDAGALVTSGIAIGGYYAAPLRLAPGTIGSLLGLQTLAFAAGALCGGRLGDRFGRRTVFTLSLVLYAVGVLLLMTATGPAPFSATTRKCRTTRTFAIIYCFSSTSTATTATA